MACRRSSDCLDSPRACRSPSVRRCEIADIVHTVTAPKRLILISDCPPSIVATRHIEIHYPSGTSLAASPNQVIYRSPLLEPYASGTPVTRATRLSLDKAISYGLL